MDTHRKKAICNIYAGIIVGLVAPQLEQLQGHLVQEVRQALHSIRCILVRAYRIRMKFLSLLKRVLDRKKYKRAVIS